MLIGCKEYHHEGTAELPAKYIIRTATNFCEKVRQNQEKIQCFRIRLTKKTS
jgi:hypothetical protein